MHVGVRQDVVFVKYCTVFTKPDKHTHAHTYDVIMLNECWLYKDDIINESSRTVKPKNLGYKDFR